MDTVLEPKVIVHLPMRGYEADVYELTIDEARALRRELARQIPVARGSRYLWLYRGIHERAGGEQVELPMFTKLSATACWGEVDRLYRSMLDPADVQAVFVNARIGDGPYPHYET